MRYSNSINILELFFLLYIQIYKIPGKLFLSREIDFQDGRLQWSPTEIPY